MKVQSSKGSWQMQRLAESVDTPYEARQPDDPSRFLAMVKTQGEVGRPGTTADETLGDDFAKEFADCLNRNIQDAALTMDEIKHIATQFCRLP